MKRHQTVELYFFFKSLINKKTPINMLIANNYIKLEKIYKEHLKQIREVEDKYLIKENDKYLGIEKEGIRVENPIYYEDIECKDRNKFKEELSYIIKQDDNVEVNKINSKKTYIEEGRQRTVAQWLDENIIPSYIIKLTKYKLIV